MTKSIDDRSNGSRCFPFLVGVLVGASCIFPRGCDYRQPQIRELDENHLELIESPYKITIYNKQLDKTYLPNNDR